MTEKQVKAKYITTHKELERQYYKYGLISEEEFIQLHGRNWNDMEIELIAKGYRQPPKLLIDPLIKLAKLEERIAELEAKDV